MPEIFCKVCQKFVCESCQEESRKGHEPSHAAVKFSLMDEEEIAAKLKGTSAKDGGSKSGSESESED